MNILLFAALILYFAATVLQFTAAAMKKPALHTAARLVLLAGFAAHTAFTVWRGIAAGRLPLANQFEFASGFAWAAVVLGFLLRHRLGQEGILRFHAFPNHPLRLHASEIPRSWGPM